MLPGHDCEQCLDRRRHIHRLPPLASGRARPAPRPAAIALTPPGQALLPCTNVRQDTFANSKPISSSETGDGWQQMSPALYREGTTAYKSPLRRRLIGYESSTVACMHRPRAGTETISCFRVRHPAGPSLSYLCRMPFEHRQRLHQIFAFLSSVLDLLRAFIRM